MTQHAGLSLHVYFCNKVWDVGEDVTLIVEPSCNVSCQECILYPMALVSFRPRYYFVSPLL